MKILFAVMWLYGGAALLYGIFGLFSKKTRQRALRLLPIGLGIAGLALVLGHMYPDVWKASSESTRQDKSTQTEGAQSPATTVETAPDVLYPMRGLAKDFAQDFNAAASKIGVSQRFAKTKCLTGEVVTTCQYAASGTLAAVAIGHNDSAGMADNVSLLFSGDKSKVADFVISIGIMMAVYAPDATKEERGVAIRTLFDGIKANSSKGSEVELYGTRFGLSANGLLMATATNARNKR